MILISYIIKSFGLWNQRCPPFSIQSIVSKGKGLIANRKIKFGETIVTERPIFVLKNSQFSDFDSWCIEVVNLVKNLPQEKLRKYLDLADNDYFNKTSEFLYLKGVKKKRCGQDDKHRGERKFFLTFLG